MSSNGSYRIGVDAGGTFTDVTALRVEDGDIFTAKIPSTPSDPSQAFNLAIQTILEISGADPSDVTSLVHGTTVATNALLGRPNQNMALVVNEGFQHVLEIARQSAPEGFGSSYFWVKPSRLVPVERVYELGGRIDFKGEEISPIDEELARDLAYKLKKMDVETVAICLLHSYANPAHERLLRKYFSEEHPECYVSLSSDVLPEYQEYERVVATIMDAACKPAIRSYFDRAIENLSNIFPATPPFRIMTSNGGVTGMARVVEHPLSTAMSGPAAGVIASAHLASVSGINKAITLDGGGTSTEVSMIEDAHPIIATSSKLGNHEISLPMIDIATVGVGGGSVAQVTGDKKLRVGPRSAGAVPGPMCYGRGGEEPTVTDALLFLGLLPESLAGGELSLDSRQASTGIEHIAKDLEIPPHRAARGIVSMAAWEHALAIREKTVHEGKDPREYVLIAFGGMGPLLASEIAGILGITEIVVPARAGNNSSVGLVEVSPRYDYVKTHLSILNDASLADIQSQFDLMMLDAASDLDADNISSERRSFSRSLDLRYFGEGQEVGVEVPHLDSSAFDL
ncbi:MAG: hydantoinase/oxoprolinase family protein, partial [Nitrospinaceae bacterium]|nr:hydantoinase/oxoprolinase family protein [Nitrospinaceae bacterium]